MFKIKQCAPAAMAYIYSDFESCSSMENDEYEVGDSAEYQSSESHKAVSIPDAGSALRQNPADKQEHTSILRKSERLAEKKKSFNYKTVE